MLKFQRVAAVWGGLLVVALCGGTVSAQLLDNGGPRPTPDPLPLPSRVDQALNPIIRLPGDVSFDFADEALTDLQKLQIVRANVLAWQQVQAALRYLQANARRIVAGSDLFYNSTFGQFYDRSDRNPLLGQYDLDVPAVRAQGRPMGIADVNGNTVTFEDNTPFLNNIQVGDRIVIGNQVHVIAEIDVDDSNTTNNNNNDEILGTIKRVNVQQDDQGQGGGNNNGGQRRQRSQNNNQDLSIPTLTSITLEQDFNDRNGTIDTSALEVRRVLGTTTVTNREHYERVVRTFQAIRDLLELDTQYSGDWNVMEAAFNRVFQVGQGQSQGQQQTPPGSFNFEGTDYDRSFRQFGFSNSNSQLHLDQRFFDPENPLHWTADNARIRDADGNPIAGEDLLFFNDQLTIFGEFDQGATQGQNPQPGTNTVFVGGGFLGENQRGVGGLFDDKPSSREQRTDLLQYQMIISAFAEFSPFFRSTDVDAQGDPVSSFGPGFGILEILTQFGFPNGTAELPFAQNMDAQVFASFANIFSDPRLNTGIGNGSLLPPLGKNARARSDDFILTFPFDPVIPLQ